MSVGCMLRGEGKGKRGMLRRDVCRESVARKRAWWRRMESQLLPCFCEVEVQCFADVCQRLLWSQSGKSECCHLEPSRGRSDQQLKVCALKLHASHLTPLACELFPSLIAICLPWRSACLRRAYSLCPMSRFGHPRTNAGFIKALRGSPSTFLGLSLIL